MSRKPRSKGTEVGEPKRPSFTDLGTTEQDVMVQLVQSRRVGIIQLAADLWRTTPDWRATDPYPLLEYVIDSLCTRGLVVVSLAPLYASTIQRPIDIRLTPTGWAMMGFPNRMAEVGSYGRHAATPARRTDGTNYRNHYFAAQGGAIERDDFPTHKRNFPQHVHMYGETMSAPVRTTEDYQMARGYNKVTPEMEATVLAQREYLGLASSYTAIAEATGIGERQVKYILVDLPRLRRIHHGDDKLAKSLKERAFAVIEEAGPIKDVAELRRILGSGDDDHSILHVLHGLHTQGRIDFTERGNGMGTATVIDIRLPKKGKRKDDIVNAGIPFDQPKEAKVTADSILAGVAARIAEPEATTEETTPTPSTPSAPEPSEDEGYPLLDELLDRERNRLDSDTKAMAYVVASETLKDVDPDAAAALLAKAEGLNVTYPSPIEREYIRYVREAPT